MTKPTKIFSFAIVIIIISFILLKLFNVPEMIMKNIYPKKYSEYVEVYANEYNVDELLVYAVIKTESNFNSDVISKSEAKGLMQLMDSTAKDIADNLVLTDSFDSNMLFDAKTNIQIGIKYLSELLEKYEREYVFSCGCIQCWNWYC